MWKYEFVGYCLNGYNSSKRKKDIEGYKSEEEWHIILVAINENKLKTKEMILDDSIVDNEN